MTLLASEAVGQLVNNIAIFGTGISIAIVTVIIGITRGMTKNSEAWGIIFGSIAWAIAIVMPQMAFATVLFIAGAVAVTINMTKLTEHMQGNDFIIMAVMAITLNLTLGIVGGLFGSADNLSWQTNIQSAREDISGMMGNWVGTTDQMRPVDGTSISEGTDEVSLLTKVWNIVIYDPFSSAIAIGGYIVKAIVFAGKAGLAPIVFVNTIENKVTNGFVVQLMAWFIILMEIGIFYQLARFIFADRGMKQ